MRNLRGPNKYQIVRGSTRLKPTASADFFGAFLFSFALQGGARHSRKKDTLNAEVPGLRMPSERKTIPNLQNQLRKPFRSAIGISDLLDGRPEVNRSRASQINASANRSLAFGKNNHRVCST